MMNRSKLYAELIRVGAFTLSALYLLCILERTIFQEFGRVHAVVTSLPKRTQLVVVHRSRTAPLSI
jgi:hypothetical protein